MYKASNHGVPSEDQKRRNLVVAELGARGLSPSANRHYRPDCVIPEKDFVFMGNHLNIITH